MTKKVSNWVVLTSSLFPNPVPPNPLEMEVQPALPRYTRAFLKLAGLTFSRGLYLSLPIVLKEILFMLSAKPPLPPVKGQLMGYECSFFELVFLYGLIYCSSQELTKFIQYLIDSDAERAIKLRLREYIASHYHGNTDASPDEVKGISDGIRYGSKAWFELWASGCEYVIVMILFEYFYKNKFSTPFFLVSAVSGILCGLDIGSHWLLAKPLKIAGEKVMSLTIPQKDNLRPTFSPKIIELENVQRRRWRRGCGFSVLQEIILALGLFWVMRLVGEEVQNPTSSYTVADFVVVFLFYLSLIIPHSKINASAGPLTMYIPYLKAQTAALNSCNLWADSKSNNNTDKLLNLNSMPTSYVTYEL